MAPVRRALILTMAGLLTVGCAGKDTKLLIKHAGGGDFNPRPQRVAVITPSATDPMLVNAYARLNADTERLFRVGLGSHMVERSELAAVHDEKRLQLVEPASDDTTVRLGRSVGADFLLVYRIKLPELRERLFATDPALLSPVTISARGIRLETGEEDWNQVITVRVRHARRWAGEANLDHAIWHALNEGVEEMLARVAETVAKEQLRNEPVGDRPR